MATLNWIGKDAVSNHDKEVPFKLLKKMPGASVGKASKNLIVHGDNLEALKALMPFYKGKVKCIYIDPPYNTGNEGWIYNDKVNSPKIREWLGRVVGVEGEDLTRHDKWLCMMYPRLKLLRDLLSGEGTIFISINEEEVASLKLMCDEIFGENNYLTTFTIKLRHEDRILKGDKDFHEVTEYLLMYRKTNIFRPLKRLKDNTSIDDYIYQIKEKTKKPKVIKMGNKLVEVFSPDQYEVVKIEPSDANLKRINIRGSLKEGNSSGRFYMKYLDTISSEYPGYLFKVPEMGSDKFDHRYFITTNGKRTNGDYFQGVPVDRKDIIEVPYPNFFDFVKEFNNVGYEGDIEFRNGKKPIKFIQTFLNIGGVNANSDHLILDSFAGSGSTGHAVLDLNSQDGGNRKFILVEMEDAVAKKVTAERIKRAIKKHQYKESFEFVELAKPLFNAQGQIEGECTYDELANYIYFTETRTNINPKVVENPFIGENAGTSYYLIFKEMNKNDLTRGALSKLKVKGPAVIYADRCLVDEDELRAKGIVFKQIPYEIKVY